MYFRKLVHVGGMHFISRYNTILIISGFVDQLDFITHILHSQISYIHFEYYYYYWFKIKQKIEYNVAFTRKAAEIVQIMVI